MLATIDVVKDLAKAIAADYEQVRRNGQRHHGEQIPLTHLPIDTVRKVGFQMIVAVRVMQALDKARVPLLPQVASRLIRHLYGAEIHWKAKLDPGVAIVHGCGLVISHAAKVGSGCILFQNVTLGESFDRQTQSQGAPSLGRDVHVMPGATLIGPISVGDGTKIMAGAVLRHSVPPGSLVSPAPSTTVSRADDKPITGS